jgi:hypothetical protein
MSLDETSSSLPGGWHSRGPLTVVGDGTDELVSSVLTFDKGSGLATIPVPRNTAGEHNARLNC